MKILLVLAVVLTGAALWLFDTAALVRLTAYCVSGNCGVHPLWFAGGCGALVLGAIVFGRPQGAAATKKPARSARAKTGARKPPKPANVRSRKAIATPGPVPPASRRRPRPVPDR